MGKRKRSAFSCKSRSQRRPSPRLSASRGPPFTALSTQGGYAHILKGYFYTNLVGTLLWRIVVSKRGRHVFTLSLIGIVVASSKTRGFGASKWTFPKRRSFDSRQIIKVIAAGSYRQVRARP